MPDASVCAKQDADADASTIFLTDALAWTVQDPLADADAAKVTLAEAETADAQETVADAMTMPPATTPSSPSGAEASGEKPSMFYSGLVGQMTE